MVSAQATVIVNALALFYVATLFPSSASRADGGTWRCELVAECERQVHEDGVHFEQSTCFQFHCVDVYLHFLVLATRNHVVHAHRPRTAPADARVRAGDPDAGRTCRRLATPMAGLSFR